MPGLGRRAASQLKAGVHRAVAGSACHSAAPKVIFDVHDTAAGTARSSGFPNGKRALFSTIRSRLALALMTLLLAGLSAWSHPVAAQTAAINGANCASAKAVAQARRVATRADQVLEDRVVTLPDNLPLAWRNEQVKLRYEIDVSRCSGTQSAALSIYRVGAPFVATAQDHPVGSLLTRRLFAAPTHDSASQADARAGPVFNGRIPALLAVPQNARTVQIELLTLPFIPTGLTEVKLGPSNALLPEAVADVYRVIGFTDASAGLMLVLAMMAAVLWLQRRHDMGFLWMTLACVSWSVRALTYFDRNVYLPPIWFEQLNSFNILLTAVALCAATLATLVPRSTIFSQPRKPEWRKRPRQALMFAIATGALAIVLSISLDSGAMLARAYNQAWALGLSLATIWWLWTGRVRLSPLYRWSAIAAYVGLIACAAHDMALVTGSIDSTSSSYLFWGFTVVLVVYALISGDYIVTTLNRAENSNLELEQRISSKSAELEQSYQQLRKTEMAGALASARLQERERLLRDMHDGLGAQLMTALRGVERSALSPEQIAQSLQDGMDELRMLMDSADMGSDLSATLAAWRNRWDNRLSAVGVQLHWHLDDSIDDLQQDSDTLLQIMRILQEAATNVVKHAQAHNLHVQARLLEHNAQTWLLVVARDDGHGLPKLDTSRSQRGLRNMSHRAAQIGARLEVSNCADAQGGCQVLLELRIDPPPERPERRKQARTAAIPPPRPA